MKVFRAKKHETVHQKSGTPKKWGQQSVTNLKEVPEGPCSQIRLFLLPYTYQKVFSASWLLSSVFQRLKVFFVVNRIQNLDLRGARSTWSKYLSRQIHIYKRHGTYMHKHNIFRMWYKKNTARAQYDAIWACPFSPTAYT